MSQWVPLSGLVSNNRFSNLFLLLFLTVQSSRPAYCGPLTLSVGLHEMSKERLARVFELSYECLRQKINGGRIHVENEASLQLQFA